MMLDFFTLAQKRESCRDFQNIRPSKEQLVKCIEAARLSPSACNSQPWKFIVINDETVSPKIARCTQDMGFNKFTSDCPALIVVCEDKANLAAKFGGAMKDQKFAPIDIGLAVAHICYAATEQGLSTCILGWLNEKKIIETLGLDKDTKIRLVIAIGYASDKPLREKKRKPLEKIMTYIGED